MTRLPESGFGLEQGLQVSGMSHADLWLRYVGVGGDVGDLELEAYVLGLLVPDAHEHDVIAQAINERFIEQGDNHPVAYSDRPAPQDHANWPDLT